MAWKISVDARRVLVLSTGHHDPWDGLVTFLVLAASPTRDPTAPELSEEIAELDAMCAGRSWAIDDSLGIGGLLSDALRLAQLMAGGAGEHGPLLARLCEKATLSLAAFTVGVRSACRWSNSSPFASWVWRCDSTRRRGSAISRAAA